MRSSFGIAAVAGTSIFLGACFGIDEHANNNGGTDPGNEPPPSTANVAPTISGSPPTFVLEGEPYEFMPTAADADGDALEFSIARKPSWANFDRTTGRLSGTPGAGDVGNFTNVRITVSDGRASAALGDFSISVDPIALGNATLSWNPPTQNTDGSPLTDLAGYKIYYGRSKDFMNRSVVVDNPGLTRYVIENLTPAWWHFAMTSVNSEGEESPRTQSVAKQIS
jgi:Putative Ig domain